MGILRHGQAVYFDYHARRPATTSAKPRFTGPILDSGGSVVFSFVAVLEKQTDDDRSKWSEQSQSVSPARLEVDFYRWLLDQASALRERRHQSLDWSNLAEELEAMARRDRSELRSHLQNLLSHLLKWAYQPNRRCKSWQATINSERDQIEDK